MQAQTISVHGIAVENGLELIAVMNKVRKVILVFIGLQSARIEAVVLITGTLCSDRPLSRCTSLNSGSNQRPLLPTAFANPLYLRQVRHGRRNGPLSCR